MLLILFWLSGGCVEFIELSAFSVFMFYFNEKVSLEFTLMSGLSHTEHFVLSLSSTESVDWLLVQMSQTRARLGLCLMPRKLWDGHAGTEAWVG